MKHLCVSFSIERSRRWKEELTDMMMCLVHDQEGYDKAYESGNILQDSMAAWY